MERFVDLRAAPSAPYWSAPPPPKKNSVCHSGAAEHCCICIPGRACVERFVDLRAGPPPEVQWYSSNRASTTAIPGTSVDHADASQFNMNWSHLLSTEFGIFKAALLVTTFLLQAKTTRD